MKEPPRRDWRFWIGFTPHVLGLLLFMFLPSIVLDLAFGKSIDLGPASFGLLMLVYAVGIGCAYAGVVIFVFGGRDPLRLAGDRIMRWLRN